VGLPDRVGPQRFGDLGNNHLVGRALIRRDHETAIALLLGPSDASPPNQTEARAAFEAGEFEPARRLMPRWCDAERAALAALAAGETPEQAVDAIDPSLLGFFLSAFQSAVFNRVLDDRLEAGTLDQLLEGDVAVRIAKGVPRGTFAVDDVVLAEPETEPRLRAFEIGPTGPMWGAGMARAAGAVDQAEIDALAGAGLRPEDLAWLPELRIEMTGGTRRPLRVPVTSTDVEGGVDEHGPYVRCAFDLPRGAFATAVMAEIMKATDDQDPAANPGARPDAT
ncbi:MAG: tRNA pseudouridine(13) synthase TruD, partial [Planctomycetota bacterium]